MIWCQNLWFKTHKNSEKDMKIVETPEWCHCFFFCLLLPSIHESAFLKVLAQFHDFIIYLHDLNVHFVCGQTFTCDFSFFPIHPSERVLTVSGPIPLAHAVVHTQRQTLSQNLLIVQKPVNFGHCPVNVRRCLVNDRRCSVNVCRKKCAQCQSVAVCLAFFEINLFN